MEYSVIMKNAVKIFLLALVVLSAAAVLKAQDAATLTGLVTDSSGASIPNANVELVNTTTNTVYKAITNTSGSYTITNVNPGPDYKVTFSAAGFDQVVVSGVHMSVGIARTQNAKLSVGSVASSVSVSAVSQEVTLNTTDASIGNNIDVQQLNQLPIYDRTNGITTLFTQQPGVDSFQGSVTGARIDQSEVTLDGLDVNDIATGQTFAIVANAPVDSVEQFTGNVAGLVSGVGTGSGGQFQLVTKTGTNRFHGNVNEYHRDTTTVANTWFNNLYGLPRTALIRNQFGGNIGGPIKRDKLFFFFNFSDSRIIQSATEERTVPLDSFRNGTLNYINNGAGCGDNSRLTTQPSCISNLSAGQIASLDPSGMGFSQDVLTYINSRYPHANDYSQGDGVNTGGYRFTYANPDIETTYVGRIDYNLSSKHRLFGRFTINREDTVESAPEFETDPLTHPFYDRSYAYVISDVWTISPNKVNQFYYGDTISKFSFPDLYNPTGDNQYSFSGIDGPYTSYDGQKRRVPNPMVRDDFNWVHGSHSLTMGGTFKWIKTNSNLISNFNFVDGGLQGSVLSSGLDPSIRPKDINQDTNNVAINDYDKLFATGLGVVGEIATNYTYDNKGNALQLGTGGPRAYRFYETEAYAGDTWRVNKKLTLSYGVRYQINSVPYEAHGDESVPSPINLDTFINDRLEFDKTGNASNSNNGLPFYTYVLGGKANHGPDLYKMPWKDFAPRVAFSYSPYSSGKTVFNGSAGIVYDRTVINAINFLQDQISFLFFNQTINQFGTGAPNVVAALSNTDPSTGLPRLGSGLAYSANLNPASLAIASPYTPNIDSTGTPSGLANGITGFVISPTLKDPYSIALNFGVQQELPGHMVLKLNYVGRLGRRLLADADANQVIDVPDYTGKSTQSMSQAFAGLTTQMRAGVPLSAQPWFENVLAPGTGAGAGAGNNTNLVAALIGQLGYRGDISDALQTLALYSYYGVYPGFLPTNIGIPSQFGTNTYLTNKGSSNYHGMLLTVDKNLSQGLRFEFNYTWSHSIDNTSLSANNNSLFNDTGFICDILQPRACRGDSDFDVRSEISSNFSYDLPFGRGRTYLSSAPKWLDEAIGGWNFSGLPGYRTGTAVNAYSDAFLASFANDAPAIFTGNKADLKVKVNTDHTTKTVYAFAGGAAGAAKVLSEFRGPIGIEYGQRNLVRGPGAFTFDAGLGKTFPVYGDKVNLIFRADAFNVFNHPNFGPPAGGTLPAGGPGLTLVSGASNFGQIVQSNEEAAGIHTDDARVAQFSLRLEF
jgi:hypothetical protein